MDKWFMCAGIGMAVLSIVLNLVFWGGLIYFGVWCLQYFGII